MSNLFAPFRFIFVLFFLFATCLSLAATANADDFTVDVSFTITGSISGLKVYAFTETGSYTGLKATTDSNGTALFDTADFTAGNYKFRADYLNEQFWSDIAAIPQDSSVPIDIEEGDVDVNVRNQNEDLPGLKVYLFSDAGAYLGKNATTDANGLVSFILPVDMDVKFRADNLGYQFWSDSITVSSSTLVDLLIPYQDVNITVNGVYQTASDPIYSIKVYLFTASGSYMAQYLTTDVNGQVTFNIPEQTYKVRADYQAKQFWSAEFIAQGSSLDIDVDIPLADADITVTGNGIPLSGVPVYVFTQTGSYLGINDTTDGSGSVLFRLSEGDYKFRADYQGSQYWSTETILIADQVNPVDISTGGGALTLTVEKDAATPLADINCYVFTEAGSYLGITDITDNDGQVVFNLSDGNYKIRADYMGYQFWTQVYQVQGNLSDTLTIDHTDITLSVQKTFQGNSDPVDNIPVYLFMPSGSYLGLSETTDINGQAVFNLPNQTYKVRADYLSGQYWSAEFTGADTTVDIPLADAEINVSWNSQPLENLPVYVFTDTGSYLGISDTTDAQGETLFRLPTDTYKFRTDYFSNQYWSGEQELQSDVVNEIDIFTGGGTFNLTVLKDQETPLVGDKTYLFNPSGSYLGVVFNTLDTNGQVDYDLPEGSYQFRVDTLGYQFWTGLYDVPDELSDVFTIPHQDVTITVEALDPGPVTTPLEDVNTYLFTPTSAYMGLTQITDIAGLATYNLPDQEYKVRADFLGHQFWSNVFQWQNTTLFINRGTIELHIHLGGTDIVGATVYLFSESGAYLGLSEVTDENGIVSFLLPDRPYKFRIDYDGSQYWSDSITATGGTSTQIDIDLTAPTVSISADPVAISSGESSTLTWTTTNAYSCSIEPDIGEVDVNGSLNVSPTVTTEYTITAIGPGGSAFDTVDVQVGVTLPDDLEYGIAVNEQQGGAGLVSDSIRILNGNVVEARADLRFPSPNRIGLSFSAVYNSRSVIDGTLGFGWSHSYALTLDSDVSLFGQSYLKIINETGRTAYFLEDTPGVYQGAFTEKSYVNTEAGEFVWHRLDGSTCGFDATTGKLLWIDDPTGNRLALAYDGEDRLQTVTDNASLRVLTFTYNANDKIESITGPVTNAVADGIWVEFGYDANNNLTSVLYADGSGFDYAYTDLNDSHNLTEKRNKANHLIKTWAYDADDRCTDHFTRNGKGIAVVYSSDTQVTVTDSYNILRTYTLTDLSGRKRLAAMQGKTLPPYARSNAIRWAYDSNLNLVEVEYGGGTLNQYQNYDAKGNPGTIILAAGTDEERTITFTYHPDMNVATSRTEDSVLGTGNKETVWDYDDDDDAISNEDPTNLLSRIVENGFTRDISGTILPYEYVTEMVYNSKGQVTSVDGPLAGTDDTTSYGYDSSTGDLLSMTRPIIGSSTFSSYDAAGFAGQATDVNSQSTTFVYDGRGRITNVANLADSSVVLFNYNLGGQLTSKIDEDGISISYDYDTTYGRLAETIDQNNSYILYDYDTQGNLIEKSYYAEGATEPSRLKRWDYQHPNYPGMLYKETKADNTFTEYDYDSDGNVSSVTDPRLYTTAYSYNAFNQPLVVTQPGPVATGYDYDAHGNLASVTDANSNTTYYTYDDMGRIVTIVSPDTGTTYFEYDKAGNRVGAYDANGNTTEYDYDALNRPTATRFPSDTGQNITYSYDNGTNGIGKLTGMNDPTGSTSYTYDSRGRLQQKTSVIDGLSFITSQALSLAGRVNQMTYPVTNRTVDYDRSTCMCRVDGVTTTYGGSTKTVIDNIVYRPFGQQSAMDFGTNETVDNGFNKDGQMTSANSGTAKEQSFSYDNNGNLTSITAPETPWLERAYGYDALNRLTLAQGPFGGDISYTYDDVGNRLSKTLKGTDTYSYVTGSNMLDEVTGSENKAFSHDANGNMTGYTVSSGTRTYVYDLSNRLIRAEKDGTPIGEYAYNGLGQRVSKTVDGVTTYFIYDFKGNLIAEADDTGSITKEYLYRGKVRLAMVDVSSEAIYRYQNDHMGTPILMTNVWGYVKWEANYRPFGYANVSLTSEVENNFRFPSQYYDAETGLHYNYHRYYDPDTGRYLTPDPIGLAGGINLFAYVSNNPVNAIDPLGLQDTNQAVTNPLPRLPTITEAFPQSQFVAPTVDIILGGLEAGGAIAAGVAAGVSFLSGPQFWWLTAMTAPASLEAGVDSYNRINTAIARLRRSDPECQ